MGDSSECDRRLDNSPAIALTGKIMMVGVILLFLAVIFVLFLHLYAKWFWYRREQEEESANNTAVTTRRRRRLDFAPGHLESAVLPRQQLALDSSVLKSLPIVAFDGKDFKGGLECAICLSEFADGEKARLLPKCSHGFHVDCIDMWFQSHSTCPLCRSPVSSSSAIAPESTVEAILQSPVVENLAGYSSEGPNFPTNVLFCGDETRVITLGLSADDDRHAHTSSHSSCSPSTSSSASACNRPDGIVVIDIPRQVTADEEPKSPVTTRLRSLKRLLSRDRDRRVNPCSSSNVEAEQEGRGQS